MGSTSHDITLYVPVEMSETIGASGQYQKITEEISEKDVTLRITRLIRNLFLRHSNWKISISGRGSGTILLSIECHIYKIT